MAWPDYYWRKALRQWQRSITIMRQQRGSLKVTLENLRGVAPDIAIQRPRRRKELSKHAVALPVLEVPQAMNRAAKRLGMIRL
jgi:hypothetical protein